MKILSETIYLEVLRRWALGEIESEFFKGGPIEKGQAHKLLLSEEPEKQESGVRVFRNNSTRDILMGSIPEHADWSKARLEMTENEFDNLRTICTTKWRDYSQGTYELVKAAETIGNDPGVDPRIAFIRESLSKGNVNLLGITLIAESLAGPYTIAEGNGRLVALYLDCVLSNDHSHCPNEIEVILGVSSTRWGYSPPNTRSQSIAT